MTYLVLGENGEAKEAKIQALKKKLLVTAESRHFDYEVFFGDKIDPRTLQESFLALPTVNPQRVILIRHLELLNDRCREILQRAITAEQKTYSLILEAVALERNSFFSRPGNQQIEIIELGKEKKANVFDLTDALTRRNPAQALQILDGLLLEGVHPLQIMGGFVWFWRNYQARLAIARYEKGLLFLQEADLNIKRSRLRPEYALEILLVKLGSLL